MSMMLTKKQIQVCCIKT